ncbi:GntR family transcriptional regulator [Desulfogranum japonicum]|uniref:GntR family transcriptional regulator n=1 Tax=Desulfogranum japonicum TaxID=231447 RepID=UPI000405EFF2|nr:GntR family transcriptional regulator [Desulfogranum japonicum]
MAEKRTTNRPRPNLGEIAYLEIKEMILTGELEQGQRIVLDDLSQKLNLSVTPIRDALHKLGQEDLVTIRPRTSHTVVHIDKKDADDILDLRLMLEVYALQGAGERLADFPVEKYRKLFAKPAVSQKNKDFVRVDRQFHNDILALSPNQRLPRLYGYLQNLIQVISVRALKVQGRISAANQEHLALLNAIEKQDVSAAIDELNRHFNEMRSALFQA